LKLYAKPVEASKSDTNAKTETTRAQTARPKLQQDAEEASSSSDVDDKDFESMKSLIQQTIKKQTTKMIDTISDIRMAETSNLASDDWD